MATESNTSGTARRSGWGPRGTAAATFAARLSFENVSLAYTATPAVKDVSFELVPGEIACLLGPSGCGKSTLLRIAAGVERPQSGRVRLDGREIAGPSIFVPPEKRGIGLMFQDFALFPHLTILENVAFGLHALEREVALTEARAALRRVGMLGYADAYPDAISGGEQQRVALARAIVPRPQVMLMDEPFSGLDQRLRESVRRETLAVLKETRASCMLVTHDPVEAMGMADRILLMRDGRLIQTGTPATLYEHPVDVGAARFFSDFNEIQAIVQNGIAHTAFGDHPAPGIADGTRALVMIRPQGLAPVKSKAGHEGLVVDSRYLGDVIQLQVLFSDFDEPFVIRMPAGSAPAKGQTQRFAALANHVLVFPAEG
jgi:iron(III) transport system ATP-binding protein